MMGGCYDGDMMTEDVILDDRGSVLVYSDQSVLLTNEEGPNIKDNLILTKKDFLNDLLLFRAEDAGVQDENVY